MILTRGARITGAVLCAVLAAVTAAWIVRDLRAVGDPAELLRHWVAFVDARPKERPATTQADPVLLVVSVLALVAALRSSIAASVLVTTGVVTLVMRLPGVWTIGASWMDGRFSDELRTRALVGTFAVLAAALALIITGAAGRRQPEDSYERRPTRPGRGAGVTTFLLLGVSGAVLIAWEVRQFVTLRADIYPDWFIGGLTVQMGLTDAPPGWDSLALAAVCLVVAWAALFRAVHSRPLGMIAAGFLLVSGGAGIAQAVHERMLDHFGELDVEYQLLVLTWFLLALAGLLTLLVLARRGFEVSDGEDQGYGGYGYPQSGSQGYGYPQTGTPGYGYPQSGTPGHGYPGAGTPGYGYPGSGGGPAAPPPPASRPPSW
ncbi:hypothetical protein [Streptomyces sp. NBC_00059]|uniref:hypothetical protein n=1 Tax=Streptomyces sp. NBC_00059 TaxID=2975635 RepID=UPI00225B62CB|nr:hypothetical protein [Streptomyces sp. NBC_00059]MCX5416418.1 hypothetical protein [Streptomyces sp. NBC_00059]